MFAYFVFVSSNICMCICVCISVYVGIHTYVSTCTSVCLFVLMYEVMSKCMCAFVASLASMCVFTYLALQDLATRRDQLDAKRNFTEASGKKKEGKVKNKSKARAKKCAKPNKMKRKQKPEKRPKGPTFQKQADQTGKADSKKRGSTTKHTTEAAAGAKQHRGDTVIPKFVKTTLVPYWTRNSCGLRLKSTHQQAVPYNCPKHVFALVLLIVVLYDWPM